MIATLHGSICRDNGLSDDDRPSRRTRTRKRPGAQTDPVALNAKAKMFTLVKDATPREEGGYLPGTPFERTDMPPMLKFHSLADGTTLKQGGVTYTVAGGCLKGSDGSLITCDGSGNRLIEVRG